MITKLKRKTTSSCPFQFNNIFYNNHNKIELGPTPTVKIHGNEYGIDQVLYGGNSTILCLKSLQNEDGQKLALKISSSSNKIGRTAGLGHESRIRRQRRFNREIEALRIVKANKHNNYIVEIYDDGIVDLDAVPTNGNYIGIKKSFKFYTMELADESLDDFLRKNDELLPFSEKISLLKNLVHNLIVLHSIGIYHRDIKAENILRFGKAWKIGDLGLIDYRESDSDIDAKEEKIGPICRLSPEATNKFLGNRAGLFNSSIFTDLHI